METGMFYVIQPTMMRIQKMGLVIVISMIIITTIIIIITTVIL
jgi:hypothetical protein